MSKKEYALSPSQPYQFVVTGGSSGLGFAIIKALQEAFDDATVINIDKTLGDDVTTPSFNWHDSFDRPVDVVINCAGINNNQWFEDIDPDSFFNVMATNAYSIVAVTQQFMDNLKESDVKLVINIVSNAAHIPMTSSLSYNASKAAALMISRQMAHELTPKYGITVMSISPNKLEGTGMSKQIEANVCETRGWTPEYAAEYQKKALMHGLETDVDAIADYIVGILLSGGYKYLSGCDVPFGK